MRPGRATLAVAAVVLPLVTLVAAGRAAPDSPIRLSLTLTETSLDQAVRVARDALAAIKEPAAPGQRPVVKLRHLPPPTVAPATPERPATPAVPAPPKAVAPAATSVDPARSLKSAPGPRIELAVDPKLERPLPQTVVPAPALPSPSPLRQDLRGPLLEDARRVLQKTQPDGRGPGAERPGPPGATKGGPDRPYARPPAKGEPPDSKHPRGNRPPPPDQDGRAPGGRPPEGRPPDGDRGGPPPPPRPR